MDEKLRFSMPTPIARTDVLRTQHIAELERTVAGLREALLNLAGAVIRLAAITSPGEPVGTGVIGHVVGRACMKAGYLAPPRHER